MTSIGAARFTVRIAELVRVLLAPGETVFVGDLAAARVLGLRHELSEHFVRDVDLHTYRSLSRNFHDEVLKAGEVRYERGKQASLARRCGLF